jgi:hypothetical protein
VKLRALCLALALPFVAGLQTAHAEASLAIQQMAQIMLKMDKAADNQQRETLQNLASNAPSANEQRLAKGLLSFNGGLTEEGKQEVWTVMRQISAADGERELAKIINRFQGSASTDEKARLNALLSESAKAEQKDEQKAEKKSDKAAKKVEKKPAKKEDKK